MIDNNNRNLVGSWAEVCNMEEPAEKSNIVCGMVSRTAPIALVVY
jgi:hypothetical protein